MESLLNKYSNNSTSLSIHSRIRSGSNKENQAPTGGNLRLFKNHHSNGPIGIPFKPKNSNTLNFHNGLNLLRNQSNHYDHQKLNVNNGLNLHASSNGPLSNNGFIRKSINLNSTANQPSDENMNHLNLLTSSMNSNRTIQQSANQLSLSTSTNSSSSQHKLSDLYKSHQSNSSSSLISYGSSENSREDRRFLPPPPKQNIMYHEQRYKTELCRAYEEQKNCVYGDRCMFAHGLWELKKSVTRHPKYKTQKCVAFEEGLCMFGTRCSFLHEKIGSAEEIVDSMLQLNKINKEKFSIPEQVTQNKQSTIASTTGNLDLNRLDTIDEDHFLSKSINDLSQSSYLLSSFNSELFDWAPKPQFSLHPRSLNSAYENIVRLDQINDNMDKSKLLPDLTSLLVDEHANSNTLLFNDDSTSSCSRLPIFEKISSTSSPLQSSTNESVSMDMLNSSNNSSKSNGTTNSNRSTVSCESTISISNSNNDLKSMDFDLDSFL